MHIICGVRYQDSNNVLLKGLTFIVVIAIRGVYKEATILRV